MSRWNTPGYWLVILFLGSWTSRAEIKPPANARQHWAFHTPSSVKPPSVRNDRWPQTEIDRFVLAKLEASGALPSPAADTRTLIRRMTFDLTGLPPTPDEVARFMSAARRDRNEAIRELIDRLLASPRYGERWGRHWLDVARYSDTKGYVYAREERRFVHAHAYRDWVIKAVNEDLPYDRFLLLQLAADQLVPAESVDLAAMGFVTGGRRFIGVTHDIIDDRIDVVTRGALGLTVQCARCHDHKYDPIPTADYYSLYGVFHGGDDRLVALAANNDAELAKRRKKYADKMAKYRDEAGARLRTRIGDYLAAQLELEKYPEEGFDQILGPEDLIPASVRAWRDYLHTSRDPGHSIWGLWHALLELPATNFTAASSAAIMERTNRRAATLPGAEGPNAVVDGVLNPLIAAAFAEPLPSRQEIARRYGRAFAEAQQHTNTPGAAELIAFLHDPGSPTVIPDTGIMNNEWYFITAGADELGKLSGDVDRRMIELGARAALILTDRPTEPNPRVFKRGSASRLGDEVPRQFLDVLSGPRREPFRVGSGRLELARAVVDPKNPLTARVMANRIWQHHFGIGLVKTPSDFGLRAEPPSHPQLLDWLALRFIAEGWSVKAMHRLILSSAVYQQVSQTERGDDEVRNKSGVSSEMDPDNRLLGRYSARRLEFEALRDAMLQAAGELDLAMGGPPRELMDVENKRRTIYALVDRQFLPGTFRTFDFANPDIHVAVRHETTVPQQALFFLNGQFASDRARALAKRFAGLPSVERVQQFYQTLYQRPATKAEVAAALEFVQAAATDKSPAPPPPRVTQWRYGTGKYDESAKTVRNFKALPHFNGSAWQGAAEMPGGETGWAQLTAEGGHPGNTRDQACIRRWIAPHDGKIKIAGNLKHEPEQGDGVRAFIVSSRQGELKAATVHKSKADLAVRSVTVEAGETIDFVVDIGGTLSYDQFLWSPTITAIADETLGTMWDARAEFDGPRSAPRWLSPWEQYAQVLLLANEMAFVD